MAWWSRMSGYLTVDELVQPAAQAAGVDAGQVRDALESLLAVLQSHGLVCLSGERNQQGPDAVEAAEYPFPSEAQLGQIAAACEPLDLDAIVNRDLMALGTYVGGQDNTQGTSPCTVNQGGIDDAQTVTPCRPGTGYGYWNWGWHGVTCQ
jgi:hypothetical protein